MQVCVDDVDLDAELDKSRSQIPKVGNIRVCKHAVAQSFSNFRILGDAPHRHEAAWACRSNGNHGNTTCWNRTRR